MTILHALIWTLLVPSAVSATAIALSRRIGRGGSSGRRGRWGVAIGLGLGYFAGHVGILGWPSVPPIEAKQWVPWLALASTVLGVVEASWFVPKGATWGVRAVFVSLLVGSVLWSQVENHWEVREAACWLGGLGAVVLLSWWNLEAQAERLSGPGWVVPIGLVTAGWAVVQVLSFDASLGQLDGVLAAALLGALPTVGLRPGLALSKGGPAITTMVLAGLGLTGIFYSNVPKPVALILVLAPWTPWVDRIGFIRRRSYWTRASVRFLAVLLTVGLAVFLADAWASRLLEDGSGL
jgi:hypothetical protein